MPGQVYYNATRKLVLTGADGVVFVADSQRVRLEANLESLRNLHENLEEQGRQLDETPHILQYNKRDLPELISIEELEQRLNPHAAPSFASVATAGDGIYEALEAITRAVLEDFENRMPEHRELITGQLMVPEGGLADALRQAEVDEVEAKEKQSLCLDFPADSVAADFVNAVHATSDVGEEAARLAAEPGTRPGVGTLDALSPPWASNIPALRPNDESNPTVPSIQESWETQPGFSLSRMWPHADREIVRSVEKALAQCDWVSAVTDCGRLVERTLAVVAQVGGEPGLVQVPAVCCILLGVDGRKYLEFQRVLTSVRESCIPSEHEALQAFAFALGVRQAQASLSSE